MPGSRSIRKVSLRSNHSRNDYGNPRTQQTLQVWKVCQHAEHWSAFNNMSWRFAPSLLKVRRRPISHLGQNCHGDMQRVRFVTNLVHRPCAPETHATVIHELSAMYPEVSRTQPKFGTGRCVGKKSDVHDGSAKKKKDDICNRRQITPQRNYVHYG